MTAGLVRFGKAKVRMRARRDSNEAKKEDVDVDVDVVSSPVRLSLSPSPSPQNRLRLVDALGFTLTSSQLMPGQVYAKLVETSGKSDAEWKKFREKRCYGERCLIRSKKLVNMVASHGLDEGDRAQCWYTWSGRERTESHFIPKREDEEENNPPLTFFHFLFSSESFPASFLLRDVSGAAVLRKQSKRSYTSIYEEAMERALGQQEGKGKEKKNKKEEEEDGKSLESGGIFIDLKQIDLDLPRTFPEHSQFKEGKSEKRLALRRILVAASYHTTFGYFQGMNFLAGFVILVMTNASRMTEEEAFWVFVALVKTMSRYFEKANLSGVKKDLDHLAVLTKKNLPHVYAHLKKVGLQDFSLCFPKWIMCMFIGTLENPLLLKVWDAFWCFRGDRRTFLHKLSIFLLRSQSDALLKSDNLADVYGVLKECGKKFESVHDVLCGIQATDVDSRLVVRSTSAGGRKRKQGCLAVEENAERLPKPSSSSVRKRPMTIETTSSFTTFSPAPSDENNLMKNDIPMTPITKTLQMWISSGTPLMRMKTAGMKRQMSKSLRRSTTAQRTAMKNLELNSIEMKAISKELVF